MDIDFVIRLATVFLCSIVVLLLLVTFKENVFRNIFYQILVILFSIFLPTYYVIKEMRLASYVNQEEELSSLYLASAKKALNARNINFFEAPDDILFYHKLYADEVIYDVAYSKNKYLYIFKNEGTIKIFPDKNKVRILNRANGVKYWEYTYLNKNVETDTIHISKEGKTLTQPKE